LFGGWNLISLSEARVNVFCQKAANLGRDKGYFPEHLASTNDTSNCANGMHDQQQGC